LRRGIASPTFASRTAELGSGRASGASISIHPVRERFPPAICACCVASRKSATGVCLLSISGTRI